ncbi:unnamed protein product [Urochloa humidicola]
MSFVRNACHRYVVVAIGLVLSILVAAAQTASGRPPSPAPPAQQHGDIVREGRRVRSSPSEYEHRAQRQGQQGHARRPAAAERPRGRRRAWSLTRSARQAARAEEGNGRGWLPDAKGDVFLAWSMQAL